MCRKNTGLQAHIATDIVDKRQEIKALEKGLEIHEM